MNSETRKAMYCGVHARYSSTDARWFATISFATMAVAYIGMISSKVSYLGIEFDIGSYVGLGSFTLTESMLMVPLHFIVAMIFFGGVA